MADRPTHLPPPPPPSKPPKVFAPGWGLEFEQAAPLVPKHLHRFDHIKLCTPFFLIMTIHSAMQGRARRERAAAETSGPSGEKEARVSFGRPIDQGDISAWANGESH